MREQYLKLERKRRRGALLLLALLLLSMCYCVTLGYANTSFSDVLEALFYAGTGKVLDGSQIASYKIILLMRFPRLFMGVLAGMGLATSGAVMQSITRNPLVSPFTIGVSNAAAFGAAVAILFFGQASLGGETLVVLSAFGFSCLCALVLFQFSSVLGNSSISLVLTGIALNYFFSSLSSGIKYFADDRSLSSIVHWAFGSFNAATWKENLFLLVLVILCLCPIFFYQKDLEVLSISDDQYAQSLGIRAERVRKITGAASILMTAGIISFTGVIGFVGVISPHIARIFVGNHYKYLLPYSMLVASILLVLSDTFGRLIISPTVLPVGIVTSFIGTPMFIFLLIQDRRRKHAL